MSEPAAVNPPRYVVGIDLGTSNCALAFVDTARPGPPEVVDFPVPQLCRVGEVAERATLPSFLYLPAGGEFPAGTLRLPWSGEGPTEAGAVVGELARWQGARVPGRLVASAKSWLCHPGIDRSAPVLPWTTSADVVRVSPVEASARYLEHLAAAWNRVHPGEPLAAQEVVITVPASFDAVARALTVEASRRAGFSDFTLVEEPQAAFEAFLFRTGHRDDTAVALAAMRLILVVDVGGGTTDFTLVQIESGSTGPTFRRVAVGDHLMLGGDNMDTALARWAEARMTAGGRKLGPAQWAQLIQACREAKEALLGENAPEEFRVSVAGAGSALFGSTLAATIPRVAVEQLVVDGFFPATAAHDRPTRVSRVALQEFGLPYAQDPAIPRQLAGFLHAHRAAGHAALADAVTGATRVAADPPELPRPDAMLFNGGVFVSRRLRERLAEIVSGWWPDAPPIPCLDHAALDLDLAVARGAACHALARRGLARRVGGGSSHAFFIGLEQPGEGVASALCVIPRGHEEGRTLDLGGRGFRLTLGRPVRFPLFASTADAAVAAGDVVPVTEDLQPLPPLHASLTREPGAAGAVATVPVHLRAGLTAIGTLELWCVADASSERWRLEFELRAGTQPGPASDSPVATATVEAGIPPARLDEARAAIDQVFGQRPKSAATEPTSAPAAAKAAKQLGVGLERCLGPREDWRVPVLRELWAAVWAGRSRRRKSPEHERAFFQLAGFTLRPGFGYPLDEWRGEQMAALVGEGVQFVREPAVWIEYWVAWRRIAGGLSPGRHEELWAFLKPHLAHRFCPRHPRHRARPKGVQPEGWHEMVRLAAALEHLPVEEKLEFGGWVAAQLRDPGGAGGPWAWALGRLGARVLFYGSLHRTVPPDQVVDWLEALVQARTQGSDGALFAIAQLARRTGDRSRDLDEPVRRRALDALLAGQAPAAWVRFVTEITKLEGADEARALGDSLPVGLALA